ncbi:MAG: rhomboid family intramembrane serine protease [Lachnospiraceae bacterium]|nr:rhomboid family intramembrane serine protease [Lachnospiraceae bacterium]
MKKLLSRIKFNAPVTLTFVALCALALLINFISGGWANKHLFCTFRSGFLNPLTYVRAVGHIIGHADWAHFMGNMTFILLLGPLMEERYGSRALAEMIIITAVVTAILHALLSGNTAVLGASGIVFMLIILSSISNVKNGEIPITFILVVIIFIGGEVVDCFKDDNVSQLAHIVGGICGGALGAAFGLFMAGHEKEEKEKDRSKHEAIE